METPREKNIDYGQMKLALGRALRPVAGEESLLEGEFLLRHITHDQRRRLTGEEEKILSLMVERRLTGEPLQYILGVWEFMGLPMGVAPGVLIPRPETELLCETVLKELPRGAKVLDLCCGSGCIGISLSHYGDMEVTFCDISPEALAIAQENGERNGVVGEFLQGDFFAPVEGRVFDCIVCNPPYLTGAEMDSLQRELTHEPALALYGGEDGLDFYRRLSREAPAHLKEGGRLYMEIGCTQGQAVQRMFPESRVLQDLSGLDRVVCWKKERAN